MQKFHFYLVLGVTSVLMFALHFFGIWELLGAHPWWSLAVTGFGIGGGVILCVSAYLILPKTRFHILVQSAIFATLVAITFLLSMWGKSGFANSYGEDAASGQLWYLGFIGFTISVFGLLATLARFARKSQKHIDS